MDTRATKRRGGGGADCGVDTGAARGAGGSAAAVLLGGGSGEDGHFASPSDGPPEHLSPGYSAGYDAGFQAGLLAASQGVVPPPPLPPGPAAAEGSAGARALLGRTGGAVRTAVKRSRLPRVGGSAEEPRVGIAAFCRSLSTFVWAVANGCPWQCAKTCRTLAQSGHLEVLRWAREHGCPFDWRTCASAASGGHLEVLRWLREHDCPWNENSVYPLLWAVTWNCCGGHGSTAARVMRTSCTQPLWPGTWRC